MPNYISGDEYEQMKIKAEASGAIAQEIASNKKRSAMVPGAIGITILVLVVASSIGVYSFGEIIGNFPGVSQDSEGGYVYSVPLDSEGNFVLQSEYDFAPFGSRVVSSFVSFIETLGNVVQAARNLIDDFQETWSPSNPTYSDSLAVSDSLADSFGTSRLVSIWEDYQEACDYYNDKHGNYPMNTFVGSIYDADTQTKLSNEFGAHYVAYHLFTYSECETIAANFPLSTASMIVYKGTREYDDFLFVPFPFNLVGFHSVIWWCEERVS